MDIEPHHIIFPFDEHKTIAVAEHLLYRLGRVNNYMYLLKLIFFADRYHVRKYLRPSTTDSYYAMKKGAVASYIYNVCKGDTPSDVIRPLGNYLITLYNEKPKYENELSASDIQAIDFSLSNFVKYSEFDLAEITHAYPEWNKYAEVINSGKSKREQMYFEDFLKNANAEDKIFKDYNLTDPFESISENDRKAMEEEMFELYSQIA